MTRSCPLDAPFRQLLCRKSLAVDRGVALKLLGQSSGRWPGLDVEHQHAGRTRRGGVLFQMGPKVAHERIGIVDDDQATGGKKRQSVQFVADCCERGLLPRVNAYAERVL